MPQLILKHASASRFSGHWRDDDYDVLENGVVVGRIFCISLFLMAGIAMLASVACAVLQ